MQKKALGWQEFWAEFFRIKHRHQIPGITDWDKKLINHLSETIQLKPGQRILDLACGGGDQACELARRGLEVVGVDISSKLVDYGNRMAEIENLPVKLYQGDMREVLIKEEFDAVIILSGSFGFFDDLGNLKVLQVIESSLKPGGLFYIQGPNPLQRKKGVDKWWDRVEDGYVLMKMNYDIDTDIIQSDYFYVTSEADLITFELKPEDKGFSITLKNYSLVELVELIEQAGLKFKIAYGSLELPPEFYTSNSSSLIVIGEKPAENQPLP